MVMYSFHQVASILFFQDQGHVGGWPVLSVSDASQSGPPEHCGCELMGDCLSLLGGVEVYSNFGIRYGLGVIVDRTTWRFLIGVATE